MADKQTDTHTDILTYRKNLPRVTRIMNIIPICLRLRKQLFATLQIDRLKQKKKQKKFKSFIQIFYLISSMASYKKVWISYPQSSDW